MLSLKLWRRVRQEPCESEIPVEGRTTDIGVSICAPGGVVRVGVNNGISIRRARVTVPDSSVPVALRGKDIGKDHSIGVT